MVKLIMPQNTQSKLYYWAYIKLLILIIIKIILSILLTMSTLDPSLKKCWHINTLLECGVDPSLGLWNMH